MEAIVSWPAPISVAERLPEAAGEYLVYALGDGAGLSWTVGYLASEFTDGPLEFFIDDETFSRYTITHWLPMPPDPEGN